jgi:hypothetical protein
MRHEVKKRSHYPMEFQLVGWVEHFAKPIAVVHNRMGIASLHPSYAESLRQERGSLPPHLIGDIDRELELGPLLFLGEDVAFFGGRKAALRQHRELIQWCEFGGFLQLVRRVEHFAKTIAVVHKQGGYRFAPPILRAIRVRLVASPLVPV